MSLLEHYQELAASAETQEVTRPHVPSPPHDIARMQAQLQHLRISPERPTFESLCRPPVPAPPSLSPAHSPKTSPPQSPAKEGAQSEQQRFVSGLEPMEPFTSRQRCAHDLAVRLAESDEELLESLTGTVPGLLHLAAEAEANHDSLTVGVVLSCLTNMSFGKGTAAVMREGASVSALLVRCIMAGAEGSCGYALACASNLSTQQGLLQALAEAGADSTLRTLSRQSGPPGRYARTIHDNLQRHRQQRLRPASARKDLSSGLAGAASMRNLQSPRSSLAGTVRRAASFGRYRKSMAASPTPIDLLGGGI